MKTRKKSAIVVAFALMAMLAKPQIVFAKVTPNPIRGSWEGIKAVPPGDEVVVRLRNGQTLKGKLINISDTALTIELGKNATDLSRGDMLRVHRVVSKSAKRATLIGTGIGAGVGIAAAVAAAKDGPGEAEAGIAALIFGAMGVGAGALIGYIVGSRRHRTLIYETK